MRTSHCELMVMVCVNIIASANKVGQYIRHFVELLLEKLERSALHEQSVPVRKKKLMIGFFEAAESNKVRRTSLNMKNSNFGNVHKVNENALTESCSETQLTSGMPSCDSRLRHEILESLKQTVRFLEITKFEWSTKYFPFVAKQLYLSDKKLKK